MKHKLSFAAALWWVMLCLIAGVFLMATSDKESRPSETENRLLQGFPSLSAKSVLSDEFMTGFDAFLSDAFFERDSVVKLADDMMGVFNVMSKDDAFEAKNDAMDEAVMNGALQAEGAETAEPEDVSGMDETVPAETAGEPLGADEDEALVSETDDAEEDIVLEGVSGDFPITEDKSYLWYVKKDGSLKVSYTYEKEKIDTYAETLKMIQSYLPEDGQINFTQVPLASMANRWAFQTDVYCDWGSSVEQMLTDSLAGTERINVFSTYDILRPYVAGDTPMFYRTDHHWSAEGAYLVCAEMMKAQGMPVIPYEEYDYKSITSKKEEDGRRDTFNALYPLYETHSYIVKNRENARELDLMNYGTHTYLVFMNNTRLPWRRIVSGAGTGRKALVLCDSFGNAFTPYLLAYYDEVHMADFRKGSYSKSECGGSIGEMIQYYGIDDVYIVTSTANGLRKDNSIVWLRKYLED